MAQLSPISVYGTPTCADCRRSKALLESLGAEYTWIDVSADEGAAATMLEISGRMGTPVILFSDGSHQVEPSDAELTAKIDSLGLRA